MILRRISVAFLALLVFSTLITSVPATVFAANVGNTAPYPPNSSPVNGSHVFFIRKNAVAGQQKDIKFSAYLPAGANVANARILLAPGANPSDPSVCTANPLPNGSPGVNNGQFIRVSVREPLSGQTRVYYISAGNACSQANQLNQTGVNGGNVLYAQYAFPNVTPAAESKTNMLRYDVVIEYGTATPSNAGGIRIIASIPSNGSALISPGTNGFAFPTVGDWNAVTNGSGPQNMTVPFGLCSTSNTPQIASVGLYDADNGPNSSFFPATVRFKVRDLTTNSWVQMNAGSNSGSYFADNRETVVPNDGSNTTIASASFQLIPSHFYEMRVYQIALQNTIDVEIPNGSQSIWGDPDVCQAPVPKPQTFDEVTLTSGISSSGDVEVGSSVTFNQDVSVSNFPWRPSQWGFNEEAIRQAYNTNTAPVQSPYNANNAGATGQNATAERQCNTGWAANCGTYVCDNGSTRSAATGCGASVGYYRWRCEWNGKYDPATGWTAAQNAPACGNIVQYQCRDANGNWQNAYRDFGSRSGSPGCSQRWNCPGPSGMPNTFDPSYGAGYCRIFRCAYDPNPANYFYSPPGNPADDQCDKRCSAGTGAPAPNWTGPGTDDNCYIRPSFTVTCTFDTGVSVSEVVQDNGTFCDGFANSSITKLGATPGRLCAVTTASQGAGWQGTPPGKGIDGNVNFMRVTWNFNLITPAQACANVGNRPFFHAYGGDVNAAASFGPTCTPGPTTIRAFNTGAGGNNVGQQYTGSGSQLGAFARGAIDQFTSRSQSAGLPLALTFANTPGGWGGNWAGNFCIPNDEWLTPLTPGAPIVGGGVIAGKDWRNYGAQDVYITGNTSYPATFPLNNVPSLKIATTGNVYISSTVTDFSGIIMTTGKIYTCALDNGAGGLRTPIQNSAEMFDNCGNQLRVRGSFVADQVKLLRIVGSVRYSTPDPRAAGATGNSAAAELFFYTPETWILAPDTTPFQPNAPIESMINLPPIL